MNHSWDEIDAEARQALPTAVVDLITDIRMQPRPESMLLEILHRLHAIEGYLGQSQMDAVSHLLGVPAAKVSGVATFYHFFQLTPPGEHLVRICNGTSCYVRGARQIIETIEAELGISMGQTTPDGLVTLQEAHCLGMCARSPVVLIDGRVYTHVTADQVRRLIQDLHRA